MAIILVVDDDELIRRALLRKLKNMGHTGYPADNGRVAKALVSVTHIDAIICDVNMPEMDGITFYYWLKANHPQLTSKFAFLSDAEELVRSDPALKDVPLYDKPYIGDMRSVFDKLLESPP